MDKHIIDFIKEHEELIEENKWEEIYEEIGIWHRSGEFTTAIIEAGINPLDYLSYVPLGYLYRGSLETIHIPNTINEIREDSFRYVSGLKSITIPNSVKEIGAFAFSSSSLENIIFEEGSQLSTIDQFAFANLKNLKKIIIPASVQTIEAHAFDGIDNLTIYAEVERKPIGWDLYWNFSNNPVVWGYKG